MQSGTGYLTHLYFDFVSSTISQHEYHQVTTTIKWDRSLTGLLARRKLHITVSKEQREEGAMGRCWWSSGGSHVRRGTAGHLQEDLIDSPCRLAPGFPLLGTAPKPNHRESSFPGPWPLSCLRTWAGPRWTWLQCGLMPALITTCLFDQNIKLHHHIRTWALSAGQLWPRLKVPQRNESSAGLLLLLWASLPSSDFL